MVVFTCSSCGESLKKNQVAKHYQMQCRNCQYLTCVDCNKDFWGNDYDKHTKCITEDQKYGGKDYVQKPSSNKGEQKQTSWIEKVRNIVSTTQVPNRISSLMEQLSNFENIPRKKIKFENFVKNSLKLRDSKIINEVWELFEKAQEKNPPPQNSKQDIHMPETPNTDTKKRKHETENGESIKKSKLEENNEASSAEMVSEDLHNNSELAKFKWTKVIKNILRQHPDNTLPLKKLQKRVIKEYKTMKIDCVIDKEQLKSKCQNKISKCSQLDINGDHVILRD